MPGPDVGDGEVLRGGSGGPPRTSFLESL
jgi:hypothetical protein